MRSVKCRVLAVVLCGVLVLSACTANWIAVALADLPVLTQMALNIATLVATLQSGQQITPSEAEQIQAISAEATKDLALLKTLYDEYKANPNSTTLQKITSAINDINTNLPALLTATHVSGQALSVRITAAVNLILATVSSFAALLPQSTVSTAARVNLSLPTAKQLKKQWNQQVCAPSGNDALDSALSKGVLR